MWNKSSHICACAIAVLLHMVFMISTVTSSKSVEPFRVPKFCLRGADSVKLISRSYMSCVDECRARVSCTSINFFTRLKLCILHIGDLSEVSCVDKGVVYSEKSKWKLKDSSECSGCLEGQTCNVDKLSNTGSCIFTECKKLNNPEHGVINGNMNVVGSRVTYTCDKWYVLSPPGPRTCLANGTWSGEEPQCVSEITEDKIEVKSPSVVSRLTL